MTARNIVRKILSSKTIYGKAASHYVHDESLSTKFLLEIYEQIVNHKKTCEKIFGEEVVQEIIDFQKDHKID